MKKTVKKVSTAASKKLVGGDGACTSTSQNINIQLIKLIVIDGYHPAGGYGPH